MFFYHLKKSIVVTVNARTRHSDDKKRDKEITHVDREIAFDKDSRTLSIRNDKNP